MITVDEIIEAVDMGLSVFYDDGTEVSTDDGEYFVGSRPLLDEETGDFDGFDRKLFYAIVTQEQLIRSTDHRNMTTVSCPACKMMVVSFDDDPHDCTIHDWRDR